MDKLFKILKKDRVISLKDATQILGNNMAVYRLEQKKLIIKVPPDGLGYFSLPETEEGEAQFAIVSKYYRQCVVSGVTALSLYGLSQEYIRQIDVDIPNTMNLNNDLLIVHRVVESKINNIVERDFKERGIPFKIKIYSTERVLHEAVKYYKGRESFYRVIKQYRKLYLDIEQPGRQYDLILKINKKNGQEIMKYMNMANLGE